MLLLLALSWVFGLVFADCPPGSKYDSMINGCLQYVSQPAAYLAAEQDCISKGGHLVSIQNMFNNSHLVDPGTLGINQNFWMGYNKMMKSDWAWSDGSSFTFSNWAGSGPGEYPDPCALVQNANGQWRPEECNLLHPYVCTVTAAAAPKHLSMTGDSQDWSHMTWIGLFKGSYGLEWTDGTSVNYINWGKGQPDGGNKETCVQLASDDSSLWGEGGFRTYWNDKACNTQLRAFACKKAAMQT